MVKKPDERVILMSIHPRFASAIMEGRKDVEFRRRPIPASVAVVVVYATKPIGKIVGWFRTNGVTVAPPAQLWDSFGSRGAIDKVAYDGYFRGSPRGAAIHIDGVRRLYRPKAIRSLGASMTVPQSFNYLPRSAFDRLAKSSEQRPAGARKIRGSMNPGSTRTRSVPLVRPS